MRPLLRLVKFLSKKTPLNAAANVPIARFHAGAALRAFDDSNSDLYPNDTRRNATGNTGNGGRNMSFLKPKLVNTDGKISDLSREDKRKRIEMYIKLQHERGDTMPTKLSEDDWEDLLYCTSMSSIMRLLKYLARKEFRAAQKLERQERIRQEIVETRERRAKMANENETRLTNYPGYTSIFRHIADNRDLLLARYIASYRMDTPRIIFDCQYEHVYQATPDIRSLFLQFVSLYGMNGRSYEPFKLQLCNLQPGGRFEKAFHNQLNEDRMLIEATSKSYLDLYPKKDLVYLSPNGKREMSAYNPDKTYIIGMLCDKGKAHDEYTFETARREGIQCERLPLDRYVK